MNFEKLKNKKIILTVGVLLLVFVILISFLNVRSRVIGVWYSEKVFEVNKEENAIRFIYHLKNDGTFICYGIPGEGDGVYNSYGEGFWASKAFGVRLDFIDLGSPNNIPYEEDFTYNPLTNTLSNKYFNCKKN